MKYLIDTKFHEYHKQQKCLGIKVGKPIPTIDLISIGIVSEDDRDYYAICNEFNIDDAWNSYQITGIAHKEYWLRENVLKPIFKELVQKEYPSRLVAVHLTSKVKFNKKNFKRLIKKHGKSKKQIVKEIKTFIYKGSEVHTAEDWGKEIPIEFYAYYAGYDWVVFAQLFGKMIDLPKGFPMYCIDLKQILDEKVNKLEAYQITKITEIDKDFGEGYTNDIDDNFEKKLKIIKESKHYPKQENEHNALDDAIWNKKLYEFLKTI